MPQEVSQRRPQKMHRVWKRLIPFLAVAAVLYAAALLAGPERGSVNGARFSSYDSGREGAKALFLLTEKMGYAAGRFLKPARSLPENALLVSLLPNPDILSDPYENRMLSSWMMRGNTMLLLIPSDGSGYDVNLLFPENEPRPEDGNGRDTFAYSVGKGRLIVFYGAEDLLNGGLNSYEAAVAYIGILDRTGVRDVLFDEYHHGAAARGPDLWDVLGPVGTMAVLQAAVVLLIWMFRVSRRFGRPLPVPERRGMDEGAAVAALADIYAASGATGAVLQKYAARFKTEVAQWLGLGAEAEEGDILAAASLDPVLKEYDMDRLLRRCHESADGRKPGRRQLVKWVEEMEKIRKVLV